MLVVRGLIVLLVFFLVLIKQIPFFFALLVRLHGRGVFDILLNHLSEIFFGNNLNIISRGGILFSFEQFGAFFMPVKN